MAAPDEDSVRAYAAHVVGCPPRAVASVVRFHRGDRHAVFGVSCRGVAGGVGDVVVRVSVRDDAAERDQAEREATVLAMLHGVGAPRLYDFRVESPWFAAPAMCMQLVDGRARDLASMPSGELERLGAVVAAVHGLPVDDLAARFPGPTTLGDYVVERLELHAAFQTRLRHPLPASVRARVDRAFALVTVPCVRTDDDRLVLLHGDIASGNILWSPGPVLIDWEYARLGDRADEVAYVFGQHGVTAAGRAAFWAGYQRVAALPGFAGFVERVRWWEPVLLLGSALWWLERWSCRAAADECGTDDPAAPRPAAYYLAAALRRLDRFDDAIAAG